MTEQNNTSHIIDKLQDALDGHDYYEGMMAMCFILGDMAASSNTDVRKFVTLVADRILNAYAFQTGAHDTKQ